MPKICIVKNCRKAWSPVNDLSFHQFPFKNETLLDKWMLSVAHFRTLPSKYSTICGNHFSLDSFRTFMHKRSLRKQAVPTIFNELNECNHMNEIVGNGNLLSKNSVMNKESLDYALENTVIKEEPPDCVLEDIVIKEEPLDYISENDVTEPNYGVREGSIDIQDMKIEISLQQSGDDVARTDENDGIRKELKILKRKLRVLWRRYKRQRIQLNRLVRIFNRSNFRFRRYKRIK